MNARTLLAVICSLSVALLGSFGVRKLSAQSNPPAQYCSQGVVNQTSCNTNGYPNGTCLSYGSATQCSFANATFVNYKVYQYPFYECASKYQTPTATPCTNYQGNGGTYPYGSPTPTPVTGYKAQLTCQVQGYTQQQGVPTCAMKLGVCQVVQYLYNTCPTSGAQAQSTY